MASLASRTFGLSSLFGLGSFIVLIGLLFLVRPPSGVTGSVQVAGSETLRSVVSACAEAFMSLNPKADIVVKGGGSGDGVAALLHGIAEVGMVSRELSQRERDFAASKGIELTAFPLARDGLTVIVNRANRVASLDLDQLKAVFAGRIRNWRDLGGKDEEIILFVRASGSGTASLFEERVLGGEAYASAVTALPSNEAIATQVGLRTGAIGYTSLGALRASISVKPLALNADAKAVPSEPDADAVRSGRYPLSRTLFLVVPQRTTGTARAFVDFCASDRGRELIRKAGYVGIAQGSE
jgi:phosphate transport system substrate-binding protein